MSESPLNEHPVKVCLRSLKHNTGLEHGSGRNVPLLAKKPAFFYSDLSMILNQVFVAFQVIEYPNKMKNEMAPDRGFVLHSILTIFHERISGVSLRLGDLLLRFRKAEWQDPCDKVFVAVFLAEDLAGPKIVVDYDRSVTDIYRNVFEVLLSQSGALNVLQYVYRLHDWQRSLPYDHQQCLQTWVPDWSLTLGLTPLPKSSGSPDEAKKLFKQRF